jgi:hypothetical protein
MNGSAPSAVQTGDDAPAAPRSDLKDAVGWLALGVVTLIGSIRMDRLEAQNINPYTVPGLLPGLLAVAMLVLGGVLAVRSAMRGALSQPVPPAGADLREERRRVAVAVALCIGYGVVLVGHGLPFWLASTIYVTASILVFRRMSRVAEERTLSARAWANALIIGVCSSVVTWLVFERVFLVRLP